MKKTISVLLVVIMAFTLFAACGKKDSGTTPETSTPSATTPSGNKADTNNSTVIQTVDSDAVHPSDDATIKVAGQAAPDALVVLGHTAASPSMGITQIFYDTLVSYDSTKNEVIPNLATSWEWLDDVTLRMHLRDDVYSQLGDHFTASDVLYSWQWGAETPRLMANYNSVYDYEKTKVVDDYTIDFVLLTPNAFLITELCRWSYQVVVEESVNKLGGRDGVASDPSCGTGPYKLTNWDKTTGAVSAERNEDYWGTLPYYKYYEYYAIGDSTARAMAVEAGDYDVCLQPASTSVIAAVDNKDLNAYFTDGVSIITWYINTNRSPFNIKEVRQALALSINYDAISQVSYSGYTSPIDSIYSVNDDWHSAPSEGTENYYRLDLEAAKAKLAEAGYADGFDMHIMIVSGRSYITSACEIIHNNLQELGINIIIDQYDSATFGTYFTALDFDSCINVITNSTPMGFLNTVDPNHSANKVGGGWIEGIEDEYYAIAEKCKSSSDMKQCYAGLAEFQDLMREQLPLIAICNSNDFNLTSSDIINIAFEPGGAVMYTSFYPAEYIEG